MHHMKPWFRYALGLALIVLGGFWVFGSSGERRARPMMAQVAELKVPDEAAVERFDFEPSTLEGWSSAGS